MASTQLPAPGQWGGGISFHHFSPFFYVLRLTALGHIMLPKPHLTQIVQYLSCLILIFSETIARTGVGLLSLRHSLIFFSQLNSNGVFHLSKRPMHHIKKYVKNDKESGICQESFQGYPRGELIHIYCSPLQPPKYQTSVDGMRLV